MIDDSYRIMPTPNIKVTENTFLLVFRYNFVLLPILFHFICCKVDFKIKCTTNVNTDINNVVTIIKILYIGC